MSHKSHYLKALIILLVCLCGGTVSMAQTDSAWITVESMRNDLFQAQMEMFSAKDVSTAQTHYDKAQSYVDDALATYQSDLQMTIESMTPQINEILLASFEMASESSSNGDQIQLANARAQIWTSLLWASYHIVNDYIENEDIVAAESWLTIREYRQSTRVSLVDNRAGDALDLLEAGEIKVSTASLEVGNDLRDTYLFRLRYALEEVEIALDKDFAIRASEWIGYVDGYYRILEDDYSTKLGEASATALSDLIASTQASILSGDLSSAGALTQQIAESLAFYQPTILTAAEINERAQLLYMFTNLVAVEYQDAVRNGEVTIAVEYQETQTFLRQAQSVFAELQPQLHESNPSDTARLDTLFQETHTIIQSVGNRDDVRVRVEEALSLIASNLTVNTESDAESTFPLIEVMLDEMVNSVSSGAYEEAEQLRLEAYALFDFGPEPRLMTFSPDLAIRIEGLFWQGYQDTLGLSQAIQAQASAKDIKAIRQQLDVELKSAQLIIGEKSSEPFAIALNAAVIVFREGLEAVVILAALMAGMVGANQHYRRPVMGGVVVALGATFVTWWLMQGILSSLRIHGEKLEAIVSIVAIIILLLITNWFFHKVYWNEWIARFHRQKKSLMGMEIEIGQTLGLVLLGFTSVYREGFETVLFLQALVLDVGLWVVVQGVVLGFVGIALVGYATFRLQKRLPYRRMLVWTGVLICVVLVTMVGNTIHVMQVVGWLSITPIRGLILSDSLGVWFGTFSTWEGILMQIAATVFVIGSYVLAERQSKQRRVSAKRSTE